jgi:hypothetical protein
MKSIFLVFAVLIGCSKSSQTKLEVSASFLMSGSSGGAALYLTNIDKKVSRTIILASHKVSLTLENGNWEFATVLWDGDAPLAGTLKCDRKVASLTGTATRVELAPSAANCNDDYYSPPTFRSAGLTRALRIVNCLTVAGAAAGGHCDGSARGIAGSYRVRLTVASPDEKSSPVPDLESMCIVAAAAPASLTATNLQLPFGGTTFRPAFVIDSFTDSACATRFLSIPLPMGLAVPVPNVSVAYPGTTSADLFLDLSALQLTADPFSVTVGATQTNFATLTNNTSAPISSFALNLPPGFTYEGGTFPGTNGTCSFPLAVGASCTISLAFTPVSSGTGTIPITIAYNNGTGRIVTAGIPAAALTPANLSFSSAAYDFGGILLNTTETVTITLTNSGMTEASTLNLNASGTDIGQYQLSNNTCGSSLAPGVNCSVAVTFTPNKLGAHTATLTVSYLDGVTERNRTLGLTGSGVNLYVANGPVDAMAKAGDLLYVSGKFTAFGKQSGGGLITKLTSCDGVACLPTSYTGGLAGIPKVAGAVYASVADGSGGVYIGGLFTSVGGVNRKNLARILANGTVDSTFNISVNDKVGALALSNNNGILYLGGIFTNVAGSPRNRIAAIDVSATPSVTAFNPNVDQEVKALATHGSNIYAAGSFTIVNGSTNRNRIAEFDQTTGVVTAWDPNSNGIVNALAIKGGTIFAGGSFSAIGGQSRSSLAEIDRSDGTTTAFNLNVNSAVYALALDGNTLYAGGLFTSVAGTSRMYLASIDTSSGTLGSLNATVNGAVTALGVEGSKLFVGGKFTRVYQQERNHFAVIDLSQFTVTGANVDPNGIVATVTPLDDSAFIGGEFTGIETIWRRRLAALNLRTGAPITAFAPAVDGPSNPTVSTLLLDGQTLYIAGAFETVASQPRNNIAAVNAETGAVLPFDPNANNEVYALVRDNGLLYAGGAFGVIGGQTRNFVAALNPATGAATPFDANISGGYVKTLASDGTRLYVGGSFTMVNGTTRSNVAAVDLETAAVESGFAPTASSWVRKIVLDGVNAYLIGDFTLISGEARNRIAAVNAHTGDVFSFNPNPNGPVHDLFFDGTKLYAAGEFTAIGGESRAGIAVLDPTTTTGSPGALNLGGPGTTVFAENDRVYYGGSYRSVGDQARGFISAWQIPQ